MSSFVGSPVWGAIITIVGTVVLSLFGLMARLIGKVNRLGDRVEDIATDVREMKEDKDTVRWSELARRRKAGRRSGF